MLPKKNRLERLEVEEIIKTGSFFHTPYFTFYTKKGFNRAVFAVTVSKKVAKLAVSRNRIRRLFYREIAQSLKVGMLSFGGVFMVKKGGDALSASVLATELALLDKEVQQKLENQPK